MALHRDLLGETRAQLLCRMPLPAAKLMRTRRDHDARRLRDLLRSEVLAGRYTDGLLPPEAALMLEYAASRATVRSALHLLRLSGIVERVQGTGTFALTERYQLRLVELHGVDQELTDGPSFTADVLDKSVVPMPAPVAAQLEDTTGTVSAPGYRGLSRGRVIALCTNYLRFPEQKPSCGALRQSLVRADGQGAARRGSDRPADRSGAGRRRGSRPAARSGVELSAAGRATGHSRRCRPALRLCDPALRADRAALLARGVAATAGEIS